MTEQNAAPVELFGAIGEKYAALGGLGSFLGAPNHQEAPTGDGVGRFVRFPGGVIFWHPETGAHEVHGAILERWGRLGHEVSFLGYPLTDEQEFTEAGRVSVFQRGAIYWWPDVGPVELGEMFVHYVGLNCFATTSGPGSDEPYAVIGISVPGREPHSLLTLIHGDVDGGDTRPELIELYRGQPQGITLTYQLLDNDQGDPARYLPAMRAAA